MSVAASALTVFPCRPLRCPVVFQNKPMSISRTYSAPMLCGTPLVSPSKSLTVVSTTINLWSLSGAFLAECELPGAALRGCLHERAAGLFLMSSSRFQFVDMSQPPHPLRRLHRNGGNLAECVRFRSPVNIQVVVLPQDNENPCEYGWRPLRNWRCLVEDSRKLQRV